MKTISISRTSWLMPLIGVLSLVLLMACQGASSNAAETERAKAGEPVFPVQREAQADTMGALLVGELALVDNCLRAQNDEGADYLPIWPHGFSVRGEGQALQIVDADNQAIAGVGDTLQIGGGEIPAETADSLTVAPVTDRCSGPYWLVGTINK
ncbi:MAG: hypothetical protein ACOYYS_25055 [Chloroflexota bacterium]